VRSELSMSKSVPQRNFFAENGSKFEPLLIKTLCEPLLPHIPAWIHPNTISLVTHAVGWVTALLAISSPRLSPLGQALALIGAGVGMFLAMLGDCIDGLHARRTGQTTKLGEMLDHWLDAIVVPLATVGITAALQMPPWAMIAVNITAAMIYNAQLVLYHHTGKFIHPEPTSGVEGQFGLSLGYVALAGFFYYFNRHQPWVDLAVAALGCAGTFVQLRCTVFYYPMLGRLVRESAWFALTCGGFGVLYWLGAISLHAFLFTVVFTSFRISGTYVLRTIVRQRYDGFDIGLLAFVAAIFAVHYGVRPERFSGGMSLENLLAWAACLYAVARNLQDFGRHYRTIKPRAT
jgi:phosphatidylglycerophosphate synthase